MASPDRFLIEKAMCRSGGFTTVGGVKYGNGFKYHFKLAMRALLPFIDWNRWFVLLIDSFCDFVEIGVMGPASSGKTFAAAAFNYTYFQIWPQEASIIMSTTTRDGLQLRVFGAVKAIHNRAKERRPWLSGRVIDSRCMLTGADSDDEAQDFRNGILGVACFVTGTFVDTPSGPIEIERLMVGDQVLNACGVGTVIETFTRTSKAIVRVTISDGRVIECTDEHPFFTERGWVKASCLATSDRVFSAHEGLQIMRGDPVGVVPESKVLLGELQRLLGRKAMRGVPQIIQAVEKVWQQASLHWTVLLNELRREMGGQSQRVGFGYSQKEVPSLRLSDEEGAFQQAVLFGCVPKRGDATAVQGVRKNVRFNTGIPGQATNRFLQSVLQAERDRTHLLPQAKGPNCGGADCLEHVSGGGLEYAFKQWNRAKEWLQKMVQVGRRISVHKAGRGNGRRPTRNISEGENGFPADQVTGGNWVDSVEILEPRSANGTGSSEGNYTVHNIEVSGHPSYSVNGVLVHNCKIGGTFQGISNYVGIKNAHVLLTADEASLMAPGFLNSVANLRKGGKETWKLIALGNPSDRNDPLGQVCEPNLSIGGWEGLQFEERTRTWPTRHPRGLAIQLCGTDSPNYDHPRGLNPHIGLITPEQIEVDLAFYGKDSLQFSMMNLGMMPRDGEKRRVVTVTLCESHLAFEDVTWGHTPLTRVIGIDPAYSGVGGDRTVLTELAFGKDVFGNSVIAVAEPQTIIQATTKTTLEVQAQIALFVRKYAEDRKIPPENVGFDSTGRGTLMSAFANLWEPSGRRVVPIEFGGKPDALRQVRADTDQLEIDAYDNMVTALWFASRLVIESRQLRQLARDCAIEGSFREWGLKGKRVFVEPKDQTKKRMGRSPDLWDSLVTAIEMARRRGFQISAGAHVGFAKTPVPSWMVERQRMVRSQEQRVSLAAV